MAQLVVGERGHLGALPLLLLSFGHVYIQCSVHKKLWSAGIRKGMIRERFFLILLFVCLFLRSECEEEGGRVEAHSACSPIGASCARTEVLLWGHPDAQPSHICVSAPLWKGPKRLLELLLLKDKWAPQPSTSLCKPTPAAHCHQAGAQNCCPARGGRVRCSHGCFHSFHRPARPLTAAWGSLRQPAPERGRQARCPSGHLHSFSRSTAA